MHDLHAKLDKLLVDIGRLATDAKKRELFRKLASDLRSMGRDIEAMIAVRRTHSA